MVKKLLFLSILLLLILNIGLVFASDNMTDTTDGTDIDSNQNDNIKMPSVNSWSDVQESVDMANENDSIELEGIYSSDGDVINVNKSMTFQGKPHATFNAQGQSGIFNITSSNVLFENMDFVNGNDKNGGAILSYNSIITFINCSFRNNHALNSGGTIYSDHTTLTIINSTFTKNAAEKGGAINAIDSFTTIINSTFKENSAESGGAIYSCDGFDIPSFVSIINSRFINNTAKNDGGAIMDTESGSYMSIINSTFTNNSAEDFAGAIFGEYGSDMSITNSTFTENTAKSSAGAIYAYESAISLTNSTFTGNVAGGIGGAIMLTCFEFSTDFSSINSTFMNNSAKTAGAMYLSFETYTDPGFKITNKNATIENSLFENNYGDECGAILAYANLNISNSTFNGNVGGNVGSIMLNSGVTNIKGCSFSYNYPVNIQFSFDRDFEGISLAGKLTINDITYRSSIKLDNELSPIPTLTVKKTIVKASKITAKYKKPSYFKVKVLIKTSKKPVKNIYIKLKIGKKTYKIKTNKNGIAKFNTKTLKVGKHKVSISSGDSNYKINGKSTITIKR